MTVLVSGAIVGGAFFTIQMIRDILIRAAHKLAEEER